MRPTHARNLALLTIAAGAAVLYGPQLLALVGGLLLALVLPGLAITESVLRGRKLARVERIVLAPALSLAVLVIAGLIVYATGFRLEKIAWTSATVGVTLIGLVGATVPKAWAAVAARFGAYLVAEDDDDGAPDKVVVASPAADPAIGAPADAAPGVAATAGVALPATAGVALPATAGVALPGGGETGQIAAPRGKDDTLVLPAVVLEEQARAKVAEQAEKAAKKPDPNPVKPPRPPRRMVWQTAPLLLVVALLGGASWMSYTSSKNSYETTVTALSAKPSGPVNSAGTRVVAVTATGLLATDGPYTLVATGSGATTTLQRTIEVTGSGTWSQSLTLPGSQRITLNLYRAGDSTAYRTLYISPVE